MNLNKILLEINMTLKELRKIIRFLNKNAKIKANGLDVVVNLQVDQDNNWVINFEQEKKDTNK